MGEKRLFAITLVAVRSPTLKRDRSNFKASIGMRPIMKLWYISVIKWLPAESEICSLLKLLFFLFIFFSLAYFFRNIYSILKMAGISNFNFNLNSNISPDKISIHYLYFDLTCGNKNNSRDARIGIIKT